MYTVLEPDSVALGWDPGICFSRRACQKILGSRIHELLLKPIQIMSHCSICVRRGVLMVRQGKLIHLGNKSPMEVKRKEQREIKGKNEAEAPLSLPRGG